MARCTIERWFLLKSMSKISIRLVAQVCYREVVCPIIQLGNENKIECVGSEGKCGVWYLIVEGNGGKVHFQYSSCKPKKLQRDLAL